MSEPPVGQALTSRLRSAAPSLVRMARPKALISSLASGLSRCAPTIRRAALDQHLGRGMPLADPLDRIPIAHVREPDVDVEALLARFRLQETHPGKLRDREHRARHAGVVRRLMVALEEVGSDHLAFQAGDGRQRPSRAGSGVARGTVFDVFLSALSIDVSAVPREQHASSPAIRSPPRSSAVLRSTGPLRERPWPASPRGSDPKNARRQRAGRDPALRAHVRRAS